MTLSFDDIPKIGNGTATTLQFFKNNFKVNVTEKRLPDGYTQLKYLQSDGLCYIDLDYISYGNDTIDEKFQRPAEYVSGTISWFGSLQSSVASNIPRLSFGVSSSGFFAGYNKTMNLASYDNDIHTISMYKSDTTYHITMDGNDVTYSTSPYDDDNPTINSFLFARQGENGSIVYDGTGTRIYYHKQKRADGTEIADLVPAKRNSDDVLGMYNLVTDEFLVNLGTGTFTTEEPSKAYTQLNYLEATGTQYIILPYLTNNKTKLYCRYKQVENGDTVGSAIFGNTTSASSSAANRGLIRLLSGTSTFNRVGWGDTTSGSLIDLEEGKYDSLNVWYEIYFDQNKIYIDNELVATSATPTSATWKANKEFGIFARNGSSSPMPSKARISALWIKEDDDVIINLVPAKRNSDNVLGMLDTVSNTFYTNDGTGEFITGEEPISTNDVKQLISTDSNTFVLYEDGTLYASGYNSRGQLGTGTTDNVSQFIPIMTNVKQVAAAITTTWVVKNDDTLWGCGRNNYGQQGSGDTNDVHTFTQRMTDVKTVRCGTMGNVADTTWVVKNDGSLWGCGRNNYGQQGISGGDNVLTFTKRVNNNVKDVKCDSKTTWYIDNDNNLYGCGYNEYGQQGSGNTTNVATFTKRLTDVKDFECYEDVSYALKTDNTLLCCGSNDHGQQGSGNNNNVKTFTQRLSDVKKISGSKYTLWAIKTDDTLYGCGYGGYGQQSNTNYSDVLTLTKRTDDAKDVYATNVTTWYIDNDNNLYGCGQGYYGQQGNGLHDNLGDVKVFTQRMSDITYVAINNGASQATFAVKNNEKVYSCGKNNYGQQGVSSTDDVLEFTERTIKQGE